MATHEPWKEAGVHACATTVYVVFGEHQFVPGRVTAVCADTEAADRIAADLVNTIRADADLPAAQGDWSSALKEVREVLGANDGDLPDVWVCEEILYQTGQPSVTALQIPCPVCNAAAGMPCNAATDTGRRDVGWFHMLREDRAAKP